jgi:hypothetical protein
MKTIGTHRLLLRIHLLTGKTYEHIIELPEEIPEAEKVASFYTKLVEEAIRGRRKLMELHNPFVMYNSASIVSVEGEFIAPEEWKEIINKSLKERIGFKSLKEVRK